LDTTTPPLKVDYSLAADDKTGNYSRLDAIE